MSEQPTSQNPPPAISTESEQLRQLDALLAIIARKAATRFGDDPAAVEIVELVGKAEALVADLVRIHAR